MTGMTMTNLTSSAQPAVSREASTNEEDGLLGSARELESLDNVGRSTSRAESRSRSKERSKRVAALGSEGTAASSTQQVSPRARWILGALSLLGCALAAALACPPIRIWEGDQLRSIAKATAEAKASRGAPSRGPQPVLDGLRQQDLRSRGEVGTKYVGIRHQAGACLNAIIPHTRRSPVQTWACVHGYEEQEWHFDHTSGQLRNPGGLCLDAEPDKEDGEVHLWSCYQEGARSQEWSFGYGSRRGLIMNAFSYCLAAADGSANGALTYMRKCDSSDKSQLWDVSDIAPAQAPAEESKEEAA